MVILPISHNIAFDQHEKHKGDLQELQNMKKEIGQRPQLGRDLEYMRIATAAAQDAEERQPR